MIGIVNYGLGNINAFCNVYKSANLPYFIATTPQDLKKATKIILPGVGAFDHAMSLLNASGMRDCLEELVLNEKIPVLGICVGMQMLGESSEEGELRGLGWIPGAVKKLDTSRLTYKTRLPHMGWNTVRPARQTSLFDGMDEFSRFYFLHSYYFQCSSEENVLAESKYGATFSCAVNSGNIYGVQFHPEKSHMNGTAVLKNFANL